MRRPTAQELDLCRIQASLFEASTQACSCSSPIFIRRFMNSELAKRFDDGSLLAESSTLQSMVSEINNQYGTSSYGSTHYGEDTLYWMGYIYRYWSAVSGLPSKQVYKAIQARELSMLYYPYHSLDPAQAIARICEAKGIEPVPPTPSDGYIEEGVALLRRMHQRSSYEYYVTEL